MSSNTLQASAKIMVKALELGADLVGWASVEDLKNCPSCQLAPNMPYRRYGFAGGAHRLDKKLNIKHDEVDWTERAECVLVIALSHPENKPELDY